MVIEKVLQYQERTKLNKELFISKIKELIKSSTKDIKTTVITQGSFVTGLETQNSDIDLQIATNPPLKSYEQIEYLEQLYI